VRPAAGAPLAAARYRLDSAPFAGRTGAGVRVAVIDSGIQAPHPHVPAVAGGASLVVDAERGAVAVEEGAYADRIGHGTAVAAAIHEKAPGAQLLAVKVFRVKLATSAALLAAAIEHAAARGARILNLSLGTESDAHAALLETAVARARSAGGLVVAALESSGRPCYPGWLAGTAAVVADAACARDEIGVVRRDSRVVFRASPLPRPIPGVPPERNLSGVSFAVANVSGFLARLFEGGEGLDVEAVLARLG
jgi:subtilisin family serine protease